MPVSLAQPQPYCWEEIARARGRKSSWRIVLSPERHQTLEPWQRSTTIAAGLARRGKINLLLVAGYFQSDEAQSG